MMFSLLAFRNRRNNLVYTTNCQVKGQSKEISNEFNNLSEIMDLLKHDIYASKG
jgi:hypothetical protein